MRSSSHSVKMIIDFQFLHNGGNFVISSETRFQASAVV